MRLNKVYIFPLILFLVFLFLSIFKISGSSLFQYSHYLNVSDIGLKFGQSRSIRSDEWLVYAPAAMSQSLSGLNQFNDKVGFGNDLFYTDFPFKSWITFFRPNTWPFLFTDFEHAYVGRWWLRSFIFLISIYTFTYLLSNKKILLSIVLSFSFYYSAFFQWWYSSAVLEPISYGLFIFLAFKKIIQYKNIKDLFFFSIVLAYFLLDFIFIIYPPFQISVGLILLVSCVGFLIGEWKAISKSDYKKIFLAFALTAVAVLSVLFLFYISSKDVLNIITNTSYPGKRVATGGGYSFLHLLNGFFDIQLLNSQALPPFMDFNQSESSSFFMYSLLILPFIVFDFFRDRKANKKINWIYLLVLVYYLVSIVWIVFGLPPFLAKITLLNLVPENRMIIGIGLANYVLMILYLFNKVKISKRTKLTSFFYSIFIFLGYFAIGLYLTKNYPLYIQKPVKVMFIAFLVALSAFFLLIKRKYEFAVLFCFFSLMTGFKVNPIYKGLASIRDNQLSVFVKDIKADDGLTVVYGGNIPNQILFANGVHTLGGVHIYPQLDLWKKFDPDGSDYSIYNRFAHVNFQLNEDKKDSNEIRFELNQADSFTVFVNPCDQVLSDLKVKYVVLTKNDSAYTKCLTLKETIETKSGNYFLYKR